MVDLRLNSHAKARRRKGEGVRVLAYVGLMWLAALLAACQTADLGDMEITAVPLLNAPTRTAVTPPPPMIQSSPLPQSAVVSDTAAVTMLAEAESDVSLLADETDGIVLGYSVEGRPLTAYRHGAGPLPLLLVGETGAAGEELMALHEWLTAEPEQLPPDVTLWLLPNWNPDGAYAASPFNSHGVYLHANAGQAPNPCATSVASEMSGPFPFSEPESRALRPLAERMWLVLFWQTGGIERTAAASGCATHLPSQALAQRLATGHGYELFPPGGAAGNWGAYLAQGDTAVAGARFGDDCPFDCQRALVLDLAAAVAEPFAQEAAQLGGNLTWVGTANSGQWRFAPQPFIHPLAVARDGENVYLLDSGQVWALPLDNPAEKRPLLQPGDLLENVVVQEPLDFTLLNGDLLVLDRVGDVYRCAGGVSGGGGCEMERYDRPIGATSSHFYVAISGGGDGRYLLETSYAYVLRYGAGEPDRARPLPDILHADVSGLSERLYVLSRGERQGGTLTLFTEQGRDNVFRPNVPLARPRQVQATETAVYVLDQGGYRLLALQPDNGRVQAVIRLRERERISAFWADGDGRLLLATANNLYFYGEPERQAVVNGPDFAGTPPHTETLLYELTGLIKPITGSPLTERPLHLPGAPRHYRLGIHEGLDFYWGTGTAVYAIADGTIIRADYDYVDADEWQMGAWREESRRLTYTSPAAHDGFRGRQVWIAHENGTISRYVHLSGIGGGLMVGTAVSQGQYIGAVGNSGSPLALEGPDGDAHLHLEIWRGDYFLGQFLRPIEVMEWLEEIFP